MNGMPARSRPQRTRHTVVGLVVGFIALLLAGGTAHADPAGPTDYRSEIVSIEPSTAGFVVEVIGGDSFILLTVDEGTEVEVLGYFGEPYLWFLVDGTVLENRNSPTTYQNEERYGTDAPDFASADAEPDWEEVAGDGSYAWHDHRAHWMQPIRPAGAEPGDQILEQVIPITVDGVEVAITVISVWLPEPSTIPLVLGALLGVASVGAALVLDRAGSRWALAAIPVALGSTVVGVWQYTSLPSETDPRIVWPLLPLLALLAFGVAAVVSRTNRFMADGIALIGAVQLVIWSVTKRDGLSAAIVPTDAPQWADRSMVVAAFVVGAGAAVIAVREIFRATSGTRPVRATT